MVFRLGLLALTLYFFTPSLEIAYGDIGGKGTQEAKNLYEIQKNYVKYKLESNWEKVYSYQHPEFRKKVSIAEFKFFNGKVTNDYRENSSAHISGGYTLPSMEHINSHQDKKDILGFPAFRHYPMTSNKYIKIDKVSIDKILISDPGKYAKGVMTYKGIQTMDPGRVRGMLKFPVTLKIEDYWEKVDGNWYITLLKNTTRLSGNIYYHFIPNNKSSWKNTKFIEFDPRDLGFDALELQAKKQ
jgi:hypothetical protein